MMSILDLPNEVLQKIIEYAIIARAWPFGVHFDDYPFGLPRALRLRLVCKSFNTLFQPALFESKVLDDYYPCYEVYSEALHYWPIKQNHSTQQLWHSYLVYRVQNEKDPSVHHYVEVRRLAERLCPGAQSQKTIEQLCWLGLETVLGRARPGSIPNAPEANLFSAAAYLNNIPLAKDLLESGNDPTYHCWLFPSPIEAAALAGCAEMLQLFQENLPDGLQAKPERKDIEGYSSYDNKHPRILGGLPYGKADPQAIVGAAMGGDLNILYLALYPHSRHSSEEIDDYKQNKDSKEWNDRRDCLLMGMEHAKTWAVYSKLAAICSSDFFNEHSEAAARDLEEHAGYGNLEIVKNLLDAGVHPDGSTGAADENTIATSATPLLLAARRGNLDVVQLLLERGANVNRRAFRYGTPLLAAVESGSAAVVRRLLDRGAVCREQILYKALLSEDETLSNLILDQCLRDLPHSKWCLTSIQIAIDKASSSGRESVVGYLQRHPGIICRDGKVRPPVPPKPSSFG